MSQYQFTTEAVDDLFEIWSSMAADNLEAANRIDEAIDSACAFWRIPRSPAAYVDPSPSTGDRIDPDVTRADTLRHCRKIQS